MSSTFIGIILRCLSKKLFSHMFEQMYVLTVISYALVHYIWSTCKNAWIIFKNSLLSHRTRIATPLQKTNQLMLIKEVITVHCKNYVKSIWYLLFYNVWILLFWLKIATFPKVISLSLPHKFVKPTHLSPLHKNVPIFRDRVDLHLMGAT